MEGLLVIVAFGLFCGIVLWRELKKKDKTTYREIEYTRIVGSETQKSTFSAIVRCAFSIFICELFCKLVISESAALMDILLSGLIGAITAKNIHKTIFLIVYSDHTKEVIKIRNDSEAFETLCGYLDRKAQPEPMELIDEADEEPVAWNEN